MATAAELLAHSSNAHRFLDDSEFWIAIVLGPLSIIGGIWFLVWVVRACLDYAEKKRVLDVLQTLAEQGKLDAHRMEGLLSDLRGARAPRRGGAFSALVRSGPDGSAIASSASVNATVATRDRAFRWGFLLLAAALGCFGAAGLGGEEGLLVPACILGGIGLGLSGMGVARREALERIRRDVDRSASQA